MNRIIYEERCDNCGLEPIIGNCWVDIDRRSVGENMAIFCSDCVHQRKPWGHVFKVDTLGGVRDRQTGKYYDRLVVSSNNKDH